MSLDQHHENLVNNNKSHKPCHLKQPEVNNAYVDNSNEVYFGHRNIFQGPVTIETVIFKDVKENLDKGNKTDGGIAKNPDESTRNGKEEYSKYNPNTPCIVNGFLWIKENAKNHMKITTIIIIVVICILAIAIIVPAVLLSRKKSSFILSRSDWGALDPSGVTTPLPTPVNYVIIHHTATENCTNQDQCIKNLQYIQKFHMESRDFYDIGYNFLVGGDGQAYEGRGWTVEGAHLFGYNSKSIGIAFVGTFNDIMPPKRQIEVCQKVIKQGLDWNYINKDYKLLAARQLAGTESPGAVLYADVKTWPHWVKEP